MNLRWSQLDRFHDFGLLVLRVGIGLMFLCLHGWDKLAGGVDRWSGVGRAVSYLGIKFGYPLWGFLAAMSEVVGGVCLILGFLHRPAALALAVTMFVATIWKYYPFGGWDSAAHPAAMLCVCLALLFTGPGKYSLDARG